MNIKAYLQSHFFASSSVEELTISWYPEENEISATNLNFDDAWFKDEWLATKDSRTNSQPASKSSRLPSLSTINPNITSLPHRLPTMKFWQRMTRAKVKSPPASMTDISKDKQDETPVMEEYYPRNATDIEIVYAMLATKLPAELIYGIIEEAEYWTRQVCTRNEFVRVAEEVDIMIYLASEPIDGEKARARYVKINNGKIQGPVRKVCFTTEAYDQGWSNHQPIEDQQTFAGSWTWFDTSVIRKNDYLQVATPESIEKYGQKVFESAGRLGPSKRFRLVTNRHASAAPESRTITFFADPHRAMQEQPWFSDPLQGPEKSLRRPSPPQGLYAGRLCHMSRTLDDFPVDQEFADEVHTARCQLTEDELDQLRQSKEAESEWVKSLRIRDVVRLNGRRLYPGWVNNINSARMEIYTSLY